MATKKSAAKSSGAEGAPGKTTTAAKKAPAKKAATADTAAEPKSTAAKKATSAKAASQQPSHEEIARHAYGLWEQEGRQHGRHEHHWHQAERHLSGR